MIWRPVSIMCRIDPRSKPLLKTQDCEEESKRHSGREGDQLWLPVSGCCGRWHCRIGGDGGFWECRTQHMGLVYISLWTARLHERILVFSLRRQSRMTNHTLQRICLSDSTEEAECERSVSTCSTAVDGAAVVLQHWRHSVFCELWQRTIDRHVALHCCSGATGYRADLWHPVHALALIVRGRGGSGSKGEIDDPWAPSVWILPPPQPHPSHPNTIHPPFSLTPLFPHTLHLMPINDSFMWLHWACSDVCPIDLSTLLQASKPRSPLYQ